MVGREFEQVDVEASIDQLESSARAYGLHTFTLGAPRIAKLA